MIFTQQWIREWLGDSVDPALLEPERLVSQLTMAGLEVDAHGPVAAAFSGVLVAEVLDVQPHPDADKLRVCAVSDGSQTLQVVCGAPNVRPGLKVPYATIGAELPGADAGKPFRIKKARLRGIESSGMLCSAAELGLSDAADGLYELPADATVGVDIRDYLDLNDIFYELDLTPNRGDCLGIRGIAREIAALNGFSATLPQIPAVPATIDDTFPVRISAPEACPRYLGRVVRDIDVTASTPLWMQEKLRRCGLRSIDPVVDVTNFVLLEMGQPMHAFDLSRLNREICVRLATSDDELALLDGKTVQPDPDTLLISDGAKPLALAGIMGGEDSGVTQNTRDVFLECAYFAPLAVAGRARRYGLHTDASHRYERGVDHELQATAMERATALLLDICGGQPGPVTETLGEMPAVREVSLKPANVSRLLGMSMSDERIVGILNVLGILILEQNDDEMRFAVPSFRFDISIEADLIEELARVHGYDNLPVTRPAVRMQLPEQPESAVGLSRLRERLVTLGYQQVISYSFVEPGLMAAVQASPPPVPLLNPISADMSVMRTSLWPGLITTLKHNVNRQQSRVRLFETGQVFLRREGDHELTIRQPEMLAGLVYGSRQPTEWSQGRESVDFFDLKGDLEVLLGLTGRAESFTFEPAEHQALHDGQCARIIVNGRHVGLLGALDPRLQRELDISHRVLVFEIELSALLSAKVPVFKPLSRFPEVSRDLAVVLDQQVSARALRELLQAEAGEFLVGLRIFDVFQGDALGKNKKSVALGLTWQHPSRTLGDDDINVIIERCVKGLEDKFNAKLRN
ncbi:MAG: phenylalanine--tRNA ligase subunit beta [Gammaproteobacteria bacterium]|nr:phenylalanine--tRNA ligase subunit beta [Gammaproteobacteria bacterium]